ncbi:MAG TPA: hypothetical protein VGK46_13235, partial [Saprospiraceae bacterium]
NRMKKLMYGLALMVCVVMLPTACKDDGDFSLQRLLKSNHDLLPSKIIRNGATLLELTFDTEGKLIRVNNYTFGEYSGFTQYEYNEQGILEGLRYNAYNNNSIFTRTVFTVDDFGRIQECETYSYFYDDIYDLTFDYDIRNRLTSRQLRYEGEPISHIFNYTYDDDHDLYIESEKVYHPNEPSEYRIHTEYTPGNKPLPDHWKNLVPLLNAAGVMEDVLDMFYISSRETFFNSDGGISYDVGMTAGERKFNSAGYLTRQVLTFKDLKDVEDPESMVEMRYEYTQ